MYNHKEINCPIIKKTVKLSKDVDVIRNERGPDLKITNKYSCSGSSECMQLKGCDFLYSFLHQN